MDEQRTLTTTEPPPSLVTVTHVIYALHAFSLITGIITAASVVGAFLTGWPSLIAVSLRVPRSAHFHFSPADRGIQGGMARGGRHNRSGHRYARAP